MRNNNKFSHGTIKNKGILISSWILLFAVIATSLFTGGVHANTLPDYLQGGGDAVRTLGNFINGALTFITALLWGIWVIFSAFFAKDLMMGAESEELKSKAIKLGAAALILVSITALPALFAGFAS